MIFCHIYIDPRNRLYHEPDAIAIDFRKLGPDVNMAPWGHMTYDVYEITSSYPHPQVGQQMHWQIPADEISNTIYGMPEEYAHNDKELAIFKKPQKNIRIVGQAQYYFDNGKHQYLFRGQQG